MPAARAAAFAGSREGDDDVAACFGFCFDADAALELDAEEALTSPPTDVVLCSSDNDLDND